MFGVSNYKITDGVTTSYTVLSPTLLLFVPLVNQVHYLHQLTEFAHWRNLTPR